VRRAARVVGIAVAVALLSSAGAFQGGAAHAEDTGAPPTANGFIQGFDVSDYSDTTAADFAGAAANNAQFVYIKAGGNSNNSTTFALSPTFQTQWSDALSAGLVPGAYFLVGPGNGKAALDPVAEAKNMVTAITRTPQVQPKTLPPVIDFEAGATTTCWMLDDATWNKHATVVSHQQKMVSWIAAFSAQLKSGLGGRTPIIYTNQNWWSTCTGNSKAFASNQLWLAAPNNTSAPKSRPTSTAASMGWPNFLFWQWRFAALDSQTGFAGDQDVLQGTTATLTKLATPPVPTTATPTISGTPEYGATLTANTNTWSAGTSFAYAWYANGVKIAGATAKTFKLGDAQAGKTISVHVQGSLSGYSSVNKSSGSTAAVKAALTLTSAVPTITGPKSVGQQLAAHTGTWTSGTSFAYQWYANGVRIAGATKSTYWLTSAERGKTVTVHVEGSKLGYHSIDRYSAQTPKIS
jgi:hypothetical protein